MQSITYIHITTSKCHRININDARYVHPENEQPITIIQTTGCWSLAPLISFYCLIIFQQLSIVNWAYLTLHYMEGMLLPSTEVSSWPNALP